MTIARIVAYGLKPGNFILDRTTSHLVFCMSGINVDLGPRPFVLNHLQDIKDLHDMTGASFSYEEKMIVRIGETRVYLETPGDIYILSEVFCDGEYDFDFPSSEDLLILDIGMNVGYASLRLASAHPEAVVVGFEPVLDTYRMALENLQLNPHLCSRIVTNNFGIGGTNEVISVPYSHEFKGNFGIYGRKNLPEGCMTELRQIEFRSQKEVIEALIDEYPSHRIVMKMDCEGSEYGIIDSMDRTGILSKVEAVMMEWHKIMPGDDPDKLVAHLVRNGFRVFSSTAL